MIQKGFKFKVKAALEKEGLLLFYKLISVGFIFWVGLGIWGNYDSCDNKNHKLRTEIY